MVNNTYAKAYTEVLEIIKHFSEEEYAKIPKEKIEFYKNNMDRNYKFIINPEIDLAEQNISAEANAIIVNLFKGYFATEEQKVKIKEILELNDKKEEQEKRTKYNPDNLFEKIEKQGSINKEIEENKTSIVEYKESFFTKFKRFILGILHISNKQ